MIRLWPDREIHAERIKIGKMPLYPMLDNLDTKSSRDNHGKVWNTRRNHFGWRMYLRRGAKKKVSHACV